MTQNKNKIIQLLIGNLSNVIVHEVLEQSIDKEELSSRYRKELLVSLDLAKKYREKLNPAEKPLIQENITFIKEKVTQKVKNELLLRISRGYQNINLNLIESLTEKYLKNLKII